jgi:hypothetical protein
MEKYLFKNAQEEAIIIRSEAQKTKEQRVSKGEKNGEPTRDDYENAHSSLVVLQSRVNDMVKIEEIKNKLGIKNEELHTESFVSELPNEDGAVDFSQLQRIGDGGTHDVYGYQQNPAFVVKLNRSDLKNILNLGQNELSPETRQAAEKHANGKNANCEQLYGYFGKEHCLREKMVVQKISVEQDGEVKNIEGLISIQEASDVFKNPGKKDFSTAYAEKTLTDENKENYRLMNDALLGEGEFKADDFLKFNEKLKPIFDLIDTDKDFADSMKEFLLRFKKYFEVSGKFIDLVGEKNVLFYQKDGKWTFQLGSVLKAESKQNIEEALKVLAENPEQLNSSHLKGNLMNGLALIRILNATGIKSGIGKIVDITLSKTQLNNLEKVQF